MLASEGFRVFLLASLRGYHPVFIVNAMFYAIAADKEILSRTASFEPLLDRRPSLSLKLREGVGGYRTLRVRPR